MQMNTGTLKHTVHDLPHDCQPHRASSITRKRSCNIDKVKMGSDSCDLWGYCPFDQPDGQREWQKAH